ncbi:MAG: CBS domain-containing protein [Gemmatimonadaceae bacterium]
MRASDIMTGHPAHVTRNDPARKAAMLMADYDCGCLPVVAGDNDSRVVGVVTDRDLALRGLAQGRGPDTPVHELMTADPNCCTADADIKDVERIMADWQVRRVVVVDSDGACLGMIAQADLARAAEEQRGVSDREVARVVERISEPAQVSLDQAPYRRQGGEGGTEKRF